MKILSISQSDLDGGAARAAHRVASELIDMDVDLKMRVMRKLGKDDWVLGPANPYQSLVARLLPRMDLKARQSAGINPRYSWSLNRFANPLLNRNFVNGFDAIHLNWVGRNMLPPDWVKNFRKPVVWTLHDSWAFTGGCHVPSACRGFTKSCGLCPQLTKSSAGDISNKIWKTKAAAYAHAPLHFVAPSRWMADEAGASSLLGGFPVTVIPNGLDTGVFVPLDRSRARDELGLPQDKSIILFGSMYADIDMNKGMDLLVEALDRLVRNDADFAKQNLLVVTGTDNASLAGMFPIPIVSLGMIRDEQRLAKIYAAADLTVVPSRSESFGQVASESLSCGTPVVAFNATGLKDVVGHMETGYLAQDFQTAELANGIRLLAGNDEIRRGMSSAARLRAVERFDISVTAAMYLELFERVCNVQHG
jgi:glycosyltransferase involved in cell wall biosynthesis